MRRKIKITCDPSGLTVDPCDDDHSDIATCLEAHFYLGSVRITEVEEGVTDMVTQGFQILSGKVSVSFTAWGQKKPIGLLIKSS